MDNTTTTTSPCVTQEDILNSMPKRRGRKPKTQTDETKVWDNSDYRKQYYHKYYMTKRNKTYVTCECGTQCMETLKHIHEQSKHHQMYLEMKNKLLAEFQQKNNNMFVALI